MADENQNAGGAKGGAAAGGDCPPPPKCPECPPPGLPGWLATYSDMVTLLLTFFVLLLSFAKTEDSKSQAVLGSIRNALGGNVLRMGQVQQLGKSPDDSPSMLDSPEPLRPFPIDFLTMEGLLEQREVNRFSTEELNKMKVHLKEYNLLENVDIFEVPEGIKVRVKDKVYFKEGSIEISDVTIKVFDRMVKLLSEQDWTVFVEAHSSSGERSADGSLDAYGLSAERAMSVTRALIKRGIRPDKISPVFYGDTRPDTENEDGNSPEHLNRRVEFLIRKTDLRTPGRKVY